MATMTAKVSEQSLWNITSKENTSTHSFFKNGKGIQEIEFINFHEKNRIEIHVKTSELETYFKIIEVAQQCLSDNEYYFDSTYRKFPKNPDCSVKTVQKLHLNMETRSEGLFEEQYLDATLMHNSQYKNNEELSKKIQEVMGILKKVDQTIKEIELNIQ